MLPKSSVIASGMKREAGSPRIVKVLFFCAVFLGGTMTFKHRMAESETDPAPLSALADVSPRKVYYCKGFYSFSTMFPRYPF